VLSVGNLFGNCSKQPVSSQLTARRTGLTCGNAPHRPTPTSHPGLCCCSKPSLSDSDGKPSTPPHSSLRATHQVSPTASYRKDARHEPS
jgi:hypothetical protein